MQILALFAGAILVVFVQPQEAASNLTSGLSDCAVGSLQSAAEQSNCQTLTNTSCVCNEGPFAKLAKEYVGSRCSVEDALEVQNVAHQMCGIPERSRRRDLWGMTAVETFTSICLGLRIYGRWRIERRFEVEDYVMMVVAALFLTFTIVGKYASLTSFGVDVWTLRPAVITQGLKLFYVEEPFYFTLLSLTKISILCFYLRIFPNRRFRIAVKILMAWLVVGTTVFVFTGIFQCTPVKYNWESWKGRPDDHYSCVDINVLSWGAAAFVITHEMVIIALPIPLLLRLNASKRRKAAIILMFSLGVFVLITSCIRLRYLISFARSANATWDYTDVIIWTALEVNVSIVTASLPAIRHLAGEKLPALFRGSKNIWQHHTKQSVPSSSAASPTDTFAQWRTRSVAYPARCEEAVELSDVERRHSTSTRVFADPQATRQHLRRSSPKAPSPDPGCIQVRTTILSDVENGCAGFGQERRGSTLATASVGGYSHVEAGNDFPGSKGETLGSKYLGTET